MSVGCHRCSAMGATSRRTPEVLRNGDNVPQIHCDGDGTPEVLRDGDDAPRA